MRYSALAAAAAIAASIGTADARINCGPGMNSDRGRCVPAGPRYDHRYRYNYDDRYYDYHPRSRVNCGPGMNSDGGRCVPARQRYRYY
jgi:hypothetical protein